MAGKLCKYERCKPGNRTVGRGTVGRGTVGRGTVGRGIVGREMAIGVHSRSANSHKLDSRSAFGKL